MDNKKSNHESNQKSNQKLNKKSNKKDELAKILRTNLIRRKAPRDREENNRNITKEIDKGLFESEK